MAGWSMLPLGDLYMIRNPNKMSYHLCAVKFSTSTKARNRVGVNSILELELPLNSNSGIGIGIEIGRIANGIRIENPGIEIEIKNWN